MLERYPFELNCRGELADTLRCSARWLAQSLTKYQAEGAKANETKTENAKTKGRLLESPFRLSLVLLRRHELTTPLKKSLLQQRAASHAKSSKNRLFLKIRP